MTSQMREEAAGRYQEAFEEGRYRGISEQAEVTLIVSIYTFVLGLAIGLIYTFFGGGT